MTRDWAEPYNEPRGDYRDAVDPADKYEDFDPEFEADHARKLKAIREMEAQ